MQVSFTAGRVMGVSLWPADCLVVGSEPKPIMQVKCTSICIYMYVHVHLLYVCMCMCIYMYKFYVYICICRCNSAIELEHMDNIYSVCVCSIMCVQCVQCTRCRTRE